MSSTAPQTPVLTEPAEPLSVLLRSGSQAEHRDAESSSFMSELVAGRISPEGYAHYLACLRRVYVALERAADELRADTLAGPVIDPALERHAAIESDLATWGDPGEVPSTATDAYVERIDATTSWGGLFVAHHYTRYLGDLSGGQVIGRTLQREYDLTDGAGVAFYRFADIPKPKPYKDAYRATLDALRLDDAGRHRVLDEVKVVFGLNGALFRELSEQLERFRR